MIFIFSLEKNSLSTQLKSGITFYCITPELITCIIKTTIILFNKQSLEVCYFKSAKKYTLSILLPLILNPNICIFLFS